MFLEAIVKCRPIPRTRSEGRKKRKSAKASPDYYTVYEWITE